MLQLAGLPAWGRGATQNRWRAQSAAGFMMLAPAGGAAIRACALVPWKAKALTPMTAWASAEAAPAGSAPGWRDTAQPPCLPAISMAPAQGQGGQTGANHFTATEACWTPAIAIKHCNVLSEHAAFADWSRVDTRWHTCDVRVDVLQVQDGQQGSLRQCRLGVHQADHTCRASGSRCEIWLELAS